MINIVKSKEVYKLHIMVHKRFKLSHKINITKMLYPTTFIFCTFDFRSANSES